MDPGLIERQETFLLSNLLLYTPSLRKEVRSLQLGMFVGEDSKSDL